MNIPKKKRRRVDGGPDGHGDAPRVDAYGRVVRSGNNDPRGAPPPPDYRRDGGRQHQPRYDQRHRHEQHRSQHQRQWYGHTGAGGASDHVPGAHGARSGWRGRAGGGGRGGGDRRGDGKPKVSVWERHDLMPHALIREIYKEGKVESDGKQIKFHSGVFPQEGMHLYNLVRKGKYRSAIEIGCAYGMSALYIGAALVENERAEAAATATAGAAVGAAAVEGVLPDAASALPPSASAPPPQVTAGYKMLSVDPNQSTQWSSIGVRNIERAGFARLHTLVEKCDYVALPELLEEGRRFDFAFIDGMHLFDYTLLDFFFVDRCVALSFTSAHHAHQWHLHTHPALPPPPRQQSTSFPPSFHQDARPRRPVCHSLSRSLVHTRPHSDFFYSHRARMCDPSAPHESPLIAPPPHTPTHSVVLDDCGMNSIDDLVSYIRLNCPHYDFEGYTGQESSRKTKQATFIKRAVDARAAAPPSPGAAGGGAQFAAFGRGLRNRLPRGKVH